MTDHNGFDSASPEDRTEALRRMEEEVCMDTGCSMPARFRVEAINDKVVGLVITTYLRSPCMARYLNMKELGPEYVYRVTSLGDQ